MIYFAKFFFLVVFISALSLILYGFYELVQANASNGWPRTQGTIETSSLDTGDDDHGPQPIIVYKYTVNGQAYQSNRVTFGGFAARNLWGKTRAQKALDRYPIGRTVDVYHNPKRPQQSVLEPGIHPMTFFKPAVGFLVLAFIGFAMYERNKVKNRRSTAKTAAPIPQVRA